MHILFIIPGDINLPTGGYRYDRAIIQEWQKSGHKVELVSLKGNYPFPTQAEQQQALKTLDSLKNGDIAIVDGLAGGAQPELLERLSSRFPTIALVHHPLCLENGLTESDAQMLEKLENTGLKFVSGIICTSPKTVETVRELFETTSKPIEYAVPGINRTTVSQPDKENPVNLLCVGSVIDRKGHTLLISALARLSHLDWQLDCIGKTDFQPLLFSKLQKQVTDNDLQDRIRFHGAVGEGELEQYYQQAHVFVLPSQYEGYGMVYAEAIARGLPVIGTTAGAIPDTVPSECGILVSPENTDELTQALSTMITSNNTRETYRQASIRASEKFPTWQVSAEKFINFMEQFT